MPVDILQLYKACILHHYMKSSTFCY